MSSISIIRTFLSSIEDKKVRIEYSETMFYSIRLSYITKNLYLHVGYSDDSYATQVCKFNFVTNKFTRKNIDQVIDVKEFLDTDDISLVLKYGRDILDENIIKDLKDNGFEDIKIKNFGIL